MRKLWIIVGIVVVLLVAVDRIGVAVTEGYIADTMIEEAAKEHVKVDPDVDVEGIPFLTQALATSFDQIDVTAHNIAIAKDDVHLTVAQMAIQLHDVDTTFTAKDVKVKKVNAVVQINYDQLNQVFGGDVTFSDGGNGQLKAKTKISLSDISIPNLPIQIPGLGGEQEFEFTVNPSFIKDALNLGAGSFLGLPDQFKGIQQDLLKKIAPKLDKTIPLDKLPYGLHVQELAANKAGIGVSLQLDDATFRRND